LNPLDLSGSFLACVRAYPKVTRGKIGRALQHLERDFGHPHRHQDLGIRKLTGSFFEIRVGLDIRLVFQNCADCLLFAKAGNHAEVQKSLRGL
jgi:mRNA-degrading endonuclease YafQ of YafQ-DinJ toxin-antitoxin module